MSISRFSSVLSFTLLTLAACGSEGPPGEMGDMGAPGEKGDMGNMGTPGAPGQDGDDGTNGTNGQSGSAGLACWDLNGNAACDVATEDTSNDGACSAIDCRGPQGPAGSVTTLGQGAAAVFGTGVLTLAPSEAAAIPGLSIQVTVPATSVYRVFVSTNGSGALAGTDPTEFAAVTVALSINNVATTAGGFQNMVLFNSATGVDHWGISFTSAVLAAGTYTITVNAANSGTSSDSVELSGGNTSGFQGSLNVLLLKM
ncbi:MAG: collagen-like protein [Kofleriaceae bacterium]